MDTDVMGSVIATEKQVDLTDSPVPIDKVADVLGTVRKKGVRLWSENGQLHYKAPKGVLTQPEIEKLRASRVQIVALLEKHVGTESAEPRLEPRRQFDRVPLAFSQLSRWHLLQKGEVRGLRQVASATRLRGRLNIDALRKSIAEIVCRQDALRTRIVICDGMPLQEIAKSGDCELQVHDLSALSETFRESEVQRLIEQFILEPIDVAVGPLFGVRLLKVRDDEYVLIVAMEHMISDGFSLSIVARDLLVAYFDALRGRAFSLPAIPIQFADYAVWQWKAQNAWIEKHGAYWNERLAGCQRLKFPDDANLVTATRTGRGIVPLQIGRNLKAKLREWCRTRRTTLVMSVFTAYVGLVLRWCNAPESVIQYESDCRFSPDIENTIGYFASALYLRVELFDDDSFVDLMKRVTEEYCRAGEHADFSYIAAQVPRPEFTRNTVFNWVPQGSAIDLSEMDGSEDAMNCSPVPFAHPMLKKLELDYEPTVLLYDSDDGIVGGVHFPLNRFSVNTMERFGRNFLMFVEALLRQPEKRVKDILLL